MKKGSAWWRHHCRPTRSMTGLACAFVMLALGLVLAGCGGESSGTDTTAPAMAEQPTLTTEQAASTESMDSSELADAVFTTWAEAMQKLDSVLAERPDPASVQTQVEQLKEEYIQKLVALGRQVAALDLGEKATMQAELLSAAMDAGEEDWYVSYSEIYTDYAGSDIEFGNLVADFNILTQYADFDLLKQQAPEEAARLGIE
jgi:ABC-type glycerol-3-phosphate transport system substrate-binding protein